jgi:hypothetical protein
VVNDQETVLTFAGYHCIPVYVYLSTSPEFREFCRSVAAGWTTSTAHRMRGDDAVVVHEHPVSIDASNHEV